MPTWLDWINADRAGIAVAILAAASAAFYAHRQAGIAKYQTKIAEDAKQEAKRAADAAVVSAEAARQTVKLEARRDHRTAAPTEIELVKIELRRHPRLTHQRDLFVTFKNESSRDYTYKSRIIYKGSGYSDRDQGKIAAGETVDFYLDREGAKYEGIEVWFNGECPCDGPAGELGHWRRFWPAQEPSDPEHISVF